MRASLMRTMSRTPSRSSFLGMGSMPHSGMPGAPIGPAPRSTSTLSAVTSSAGSSMRGGHVVIAVEHDGRAGVPGELRVGGGRLDHRPVRRKVAP